jgi:HTH-type transcriptional regulator, quorum sensing regulator NprR
MIKELIMKIGSKIKFYRKKKKLTQEQLANGIISIPYLSKIENNKITASIEVLTHLQNRLDIDLENEAKFNKRLEQTIQLWFNDLLSSNIYEIDNTFSLIKENYKNLQEDLNLLNLIDIFTIKYFLIKKNFINAQRQILKIKNVTNLFNKKQLFYYYLFLGDLYFEICNYENSFTYYKKALIYSKFSLDLPDSIRANLLLALAEVSTEIRMSTLAIQNANKALRIYKGNYNLEKCAICHNVLIINYCRANDRQKYTNHYKKAASIARQINNKEIWGLLEEQIGYLYSYHENNLEASKHLLKSVEMRGASKSKYTIKSVLLLVKQLCLLNKKEEALSWINKGLTIYKDPNEPFHEIVSMELKIYKLIIERNENFEKFMVKEVIDYFLSKKLYEKAAIYSNLLAQYFSGKSMYKRANEYHKISTDCFKIISGIKNIKLSRF